MSDLDEWIDSAQRTHRSVTLYARADLIADLDRLDREIQIAREADEPTGDLDAAWEDTARRFHESALTITVRGLTDAEFRAIRTQANIDKVDASTLGARLLAEAIVSPSFSVEQLLALEDKVGEAQIGRIVAAYTLASREQPPEPIDPADVKETP